MSISLENAFGALALDATLEALNELLGERYSGGKKPYSTKLTAAGDTTLITPDAGKKIRVVWVSAIPSSDNANANLVKFRFDSIGVFYDAYALSHWEIFEGAIDEPLIVNAQTAEAVSITVHYREV